MGKKLKDYYNLEFSHFLASKIEPQCKQFDYKLFITIIEPTIETLEFNDRQILLATALKQSIQLNYSDTIDVFYKILGPELQQSLGMFTEGYWLWPIGMFVELFGAQDFEVSTSFSKELTKRFTSEFCMRPIIRTYPLQSMQLLLEWSLDDNKRVRRLASECIRIRLPWSKKLNTALEYFNLYTILLSNLKDDVDKTIQKSVANNLNDLYKENPLKFEEIIHTWTRNHPTKECLWIVQHASRTKFKQQNIAKKKNTKNNGSI